MYLPLSAGKKTGVQLSLSDSKEEVPEIDVSRLLGRCAVYPGVISPTFQRCLVPP
jgi:hypothetical protein